MLARGSSVRFATKHPAPAMGDDHEWLVLKGNRFGRLLGALRVALASDVDVVSIHDPELIPVGLLVRALRRIPVIFDVHEDLPGQVLDKERLPHFMRPLLAALAKVALLAAERTMTLTLAEEGYHRCFRKRHVVLPNYPDVARLPAPAADERFIVYVGDVREVRGALVAVDAVGAMENPLPLVMVGRCADDLRVVLESRARTSKVELSMPGFVPHSEAMKQVARATVGISPLLDIPNYRWSLPTKVLEYVALGVPVIASDLPGTASVIEHFDSVRLVQPGDPAALAAALDHVTSDPEVRKVAKAAVEGVRRQFTWPAARLLEVYGVTAASKR